MTYIKRAYEELVAISKATAEIRVMVEKIHQEMRKRREEEEKNKKFIQVINVS